MNQRNVPGIDNAYLAMDTEEGVEVVWNEVMFSERKNFKLQEVGAELGQCSYVHYSMNETIINIIIMNVSAGGQCVYLQGIKWCVFFGVSFFTVISLTM